MAIIVAAMISAATARGSTIVSLMPPILGAVVSYGIVISLAVVVVLWEGSPWG